MAAPNLVNVTTITGKTHGQALDTTTTTSILANGGSSGDVYKINSIIVANIDGTNSCDVTVSFYDGSSDWKLAHTVAVPADTTLVVLGKNSPIYLEEGDAIRAGASANSDLHIVICDEVLTDD